MAATSQNRNRSLNKQPVYNMSKSFEKDSADLLSVTDKLLYLTCHKNLY